MYMYYINALHGFCGHVHVHVCVHVFGAMSYDALALSSCLVPTSVSLWLVLFLFQVAVHSFLCACACVCVCGVCVGSYLMYFICWRWRKASFGSRIFDLLEN